ncbi:MAG TPA: oligosaccharide flippase family protein [Polyangia bacterium]
MTDSLPQSAPAVGLRGRLVRGSAFEIAGYGTQQFLRMFSSVILTRLLFPAAFGLSMLVGTLTAGLVMLSDVAVQPCVVQSRRGDEVAFLNTAFTIQAIRGVGLAVVMALLAKPAAWFWREPQLEPLVYLSSVQLLIGGLHSTSIFTLRRRIALGWLNALELGQTILTMILTITLASRYRSAWVLVVGGGISSFVYVAATHLLPVPYRNRFHWDKEAALEIRKFGRWVMGSSAATYLSGQADRIFYGRFLGAAWLGVYGIAMNLSETVSSLILRLVNGVMFPALTHASRQPGIDISSYYYRLRLRLDLFSMGGTGLLGGMGGWVVHTVWDSRYADAAWILRIICVRSAITLLVSPTETCLFSLGHTRYGFFRSVARLSAAVICIPVGFHLGGVKGAIWGTVLAEVPTFLAVWPKSRELGILRLRRELLAVAIFCAAYALGSLVMPLLPTIVLHRHR